MTGEMALDEIIIVSGLSEEDVLRALLALRLVGVIEPFTEPKKLTDSMTSQVSFAGSVGPQPGRSWRP